MSERKFTPRGFEDFCEILDDHKQRVVVRESSVDARDGGKRVWIFCGPPGSHPEAPSPLLTVDQAEMVANALLAFVRRERELL